MECVVYIAHDEKCGERDSFFLKRGGTPSIKFGLATLNICFFIFQTWSETPPLF